MKYLGRGLLLIIIINNIRNCDSNKYKMKSSIYTKSCPEGNFVVKKLSSGMKIRRYHFLINQSNSLQKLLQSKVKTKWYRQTDADFEVNFPRISNQTSYITIFKALQQYSASVQFLFKRNNRKVRKDLKSIRNELPKLMCSVEGLINGMHAEQINYKFVSEKEMEIWLESTLSTLSYIALSKELVQSLIEFNEIILNVAHQRLENLIKNKRKRKLLMFTYQL